MNGALQLTIGYWVESHTHICMHERLVMKSIVTLSHFHFQMLKVGLNPFVFCVPPFPFDKSNILSWILLYPSSFVTNASEDSCITYSHRDELHKLHNRFLPWYVASNLVKFVGMLNQPKKWRLSLSHTSKYWVLPRRTCCLIFSKLSYWLCCSKIS